MSNAHGNASNKNVELGGRDTFKRFKHGITGYILGERRVDGGWHIAMSYQLHIALCTLPELSQATKLKIAEAHELLFAVHHALRNPLPRELVHSYDPTISQLLHAMVQIYAPSTKSECCSIKFHWPRLGHTPDCSWVVLQRRRRSSGNSVNPQKGTFASPIAKKARAR